LAAGFTSGFVVSAAKMWSSSLSQSRGSFASALGFAAGAFAGVAALAGAGAFAGAGA